MPNFAGIEGFLHWPRLTQSPAPQTQAAVLQGAERALAVVGVAQRHRQRVAQRLAIGEPIDRIRDVVFPVKLQLGQSVGFTSIFLDDLRIATTATNPAGQRAEPRFAQSVNRGSAFPAWVIVIAFRKLRFALCERTVRSTAVRIHDMRRNGIQNKVIRGCVGLARSLQ